MEETVQYFEEHLDELLESKLHHQLKGKQIILDRVRFSWNGAFYFAVDCTLR